METLADTLYVIRDAVDLGVIPVKHLPDIATELLVGEIDSPALRELAGLDLEPFTSPDAHELWQQVMAELGAPADDRPVHGSNASAVLASAALVHGLDTASVLNRFCLLAVALDYRENDDVMTLRGLDDEWLGEWGRSRSDIEHEAWGLVQKLAANAPQVPPCVLKTAASRG